MDVKLVVHRGPTQAREFRLRNPETIIGRKEGCGLRIPSGQVSRTHCQILWHDDLLYVRDLKSANGTFINGQRVRGEQVIRPGDLLTVGPLIFLVNYQLTQRAIDHLLQDASASMAQVQDVAPMSVEEIEVVEEGNELAPIPFDLDDNTLQDLAALDRQTDADVPDLPLVAEDDEDDAPKSKKTRLTQPRPPQPAKKKKKAKKAEDDENPDASAILGNRALEVPDNMRDLLSQLGEGDEE